MAQFELFPEEDEEEETTAEVGAAPRVTAQVAREKAQHDLQTRCFDDAAAVCDRMPEFLQGDDIILVKGSRTARLERVVEELIKDDG